MCGGPCTVSPQTYIEACPARRGVKSRTARAAVSYRRRLTARSLRSAIRPGHGRRPDHQRGRHGRPALAAAGEPQPVGGGGGDADRGAQRRRQRRLGLGPPRARASGWSRSAGPTRCRPASRPPRAPRGRARGPPTPRGAGPARVVGAEQAADVAEARPRRAPRRSARARRRRRRSARRSRRRRASPARRASRAGRPRSGARRCRCPPGAARVTAAHLQLGQREVVRDGDLGGPLVAGDGVHRHAGGADDRGVVGELRAVGEARRRRPPAWRGRSPAGSAPGAAALAGTASVTTPSSSTTTVVSTTGSTGTTAGAPAASAASTRATTSGGVSGRAASWTRTASACALDGGRARRGPTRSGSAPPSTSRTPPGSAAAKACPLRRRGRRRRPRPRRPARRASTAQQTSGRPASGTSAFGRSAPRRRPLPAAATMPTACTGVVWVTRVSGGRLSWRAPRRGGPRPCPRWCPRRARAR